MSYHKVLEVRYEIEAQHGAKPQFSVPKKVCDLLGVGSLDPVWIEVWSASKGVTRAATILKSGTEIYGDGLEDCCDRGERIHVTVSAR